MRLTWRPAAWRRGPFLWHVDRTGVLVQGGFGDTTSARQDSCVLALPFRSYEGRWQWVAIQYETGATIWLVITAEVFKALGDVCLTMNSNPFSTGGGGTSFENCVQALTLIDLACGSFTRVFSSCPVQRVEFQTNRLGYETDDMLVSGVDPSVGKTRRLLYQIKHGISFLASNEGWRKCIDDFWRDFNNARLFDRDYDVFVVAVATLDKADRHFAKALTLLREGNIQSLTKEDKKRLDGIRDVVRRLNGGTVSDEEFDWFVKCIHIVRYGELDTWEEVSRDSRVRNCPDLWNEALTIANRTDSHGASFTVLNLPSSLIHKAGVNASSGPMMALRDHSARLMDRIRDTIAGQHVDREEKAKEFDEALDSGSVVLVVGDAGTGKSALVKRCLSMKPDAEVVWLTSEDLDHGSLEEAARLLGLQEGLRAVANQLSLSRQVVVVVDSMERQIQGGDITCLKDLIDACCARGWHFVGVLRSYSFGWLPDRLDLDEKGICRVTLGAFSEQEMAALEAASSNLDKLSLADRGGSFFRNPYNLSMLSRALDEAADIDLVADSVKLRNRLWSLIVERARDGSQTPSRERGKAFEDICVKRASTLVFAVNCEDYDKSVLDDLCSTSLLELVGDDCYTVSHDVLEDWGVFHYFDRWYSSQNVSGSAAAFLARIKDQPGLGRAFATWLGERIAIDASSMTFVRGIVSNAEIASSVRRFCIIAVMESGQTEAFLDSFDYGLFGQEDSVFALVVSTLKLCAVEAKPTLGIEAEVRDVPRAPISFVPHGQAWGQVFAFALRNVNRLDKRSCFECVGALKEWGVGNVHEAGDGPAMCAAGILALRLLEKGYGREGHGWVATTLACVATKCYSAIKDEYRRALQLDRPCREISWVAQELRRDAVFGLGSYSLANDDAALLADLVRLEFYSDETGRHGTTSIYDNKDFLFGAHYGLSSDARDLCLAHGRRPPFFGLFRHAPMVATELCVEVCNHIGSAIAMLPPAERDEAEVNILKGTHLADGYRTVLVSTDMWWAYRGRGSIPPNIQSMLMSLENCLIALAEADSEEARALFLRMYDCVLLKGETSLTLGVAASLAVGFPSIVGEHCLPLFSAPELFFVDSARASQEGVAIQPWPFTAEDKIAYEVDRVPSNKLSWRGTDLERPCIYLQFCSEHRDRILSVIETFPEDSPWVKALKAKLNSSGFSVLPGEELGTVILTPPDVDLGEELKVWHNNFEESLSLYAWSRKMYDGAEVAEGSLDEHFQMACALTDMDGKETFRSINMFCAALVRVGLLDSGPSDLHRWCCERLLDVCEGVLNSSVNVSEAGITLSSVDSCLEVVPLLLHDESTAVRERARRVIEKGFMSDTRSVAVSVSRGIATYLWDIDCDLARELVRRREHASWQLNKTDSVADVRYDSLTRTVLLIACPASHDDIVHEEVTALLSDAIAAEKYWRDHYEDWRRFGGAVTNDVGKEGPACLIAKYLFDLGSVCEFDSLLKKGVQEAPQLVHTILTYLAGYASEVGNYSLRWALVEAIDDELVEIALASPDDMLSPWAELLIRALYGDADWQPIDYEQQNVRYGKGAVLEISSRAGSNAAVFQSLTRLMYHFPQVFSVECIQVINGIGDERITQLFERTTDSMFCLVAWLRAFVLKKKDAEITREQYECCLRILDLAIESGSPEAYFVRMSFINKRWRFTRS